MDTAHASQGFRLVDVSGTLIGAVKGFKAFITILALLMTR